MHGVILHHACLGTISPLIPVAFVGSEDSLLGMLRLLLNIKIRLVRGGVVGVRSLGVCRLHLVWYSRTRPVAECALYISGLLLIPADLKFMGTPGAQTYLYLVLFPFPFRLLICLARNLEVFSVNFWESPFIKCRLKGEG